MISLLTKFLAAERIGDRNYTLTVELMILFFHAASHINYAKCTWLYLQDMKSLKETMDPVVHKKLTEMDFLLLKESMFLCWDFDGLNH